MTRTLRTLALTLLLVPLCESANAEFIGADLPLEDFEMVDGWSGIPVWYGHELPSGEAVNTVRYFIDEDRIGAEDELYNVIPLIIRQEDGSSSDGDGLFSIWEIGPAHTANSIGEQEIEWGSSEIPADDFLYHPGALQWQQDVNNTEGGAISFAGGGGEGMHFFDIDTTEFIPGEELGDIEPELELGDLDGPIGALQLHSSAAGGRAYQFNFETGAAVGGEPGDFNADGAVDAADINLLSAEARAAEPDTGKFDVNSDGAVNNSDREAWVDIKNTWFGDANLDGEFNSGDFVQVFTAGKFESDGEAKWEEGDWDGDGIFNTSDFVTAFSQGGFENGPRAATATVPEPTAIGLLAIGFGSLFALRRQRS